MSGVDPNGGGALVIPGGGGASLSDATPAAPGTAAAGVATSASRADHVHTPTTAAQVGLGAVTATGATAAIARAAIGAVAVPTSGTLGARPASPAAGDTYYATDYDVVLTCAVAGTWRVMGADRVGVTLGPFTGNYTTTSIRTAVVGIAVAPTLANGTSFALGFWLDAVPTTQEVMWSYNNGGGGFILGTNNAGSAGYPYLYRNGVTGPAAFAVMAQAMVTGANALAVALAADGLSFSWSLNGGAAATVVTSGAYIPPGGSEYGILGNYQPGGTTPFASGSFAWAQAWSSVLSGATLAAVSGGYAALLPGDPGGATSTWAYLAAKYPGGADTVLAQGSAATTALSYVGLASKRVQRL